MTLDREIKLSDLKPLGKNLKRPECVLAAANGALCVADWRGGVSIIQPDGGQQLVIAKHLEFALKPNGIALTAAGDFLLAHLGDTSGGLYKLSPDGACSPVLVELDGVPLPPSNYPHIDIQGRIWLTISTRHQPRANAYRHSIADGFLVLIDRGQARIAADNLGYANECCVHPSGNWVYINETFARRLSRYRINANGDLGAKETVVEFGYGVYPDGLTFDVEGGVWVTSIVSNRIIRIDAEGRQSLILEDVDAEHLEWVEQAYQENAMGRPHLDRVASKRLRNISSLAFGGPDLKTAYLGCLLGDEIMSFKSPVAGWQPPYWHHPC